MQLKIRQRANFNILTTRIIQFLLFTPFSLAPLGILLGTSLSTDWWHLLWILPMAVFALLFGLMAFNELIGFAMGYYLIFPKKGEMVFKKVGSVYNQRFSIPVHRVDALAWNSRKSQLYCEGFGQWIYCSKSDSERVKRLFEEACNGQSAPS